MTPRSLFQCLGLGATVLGFAGGIFVFVMVQVLQAYPFHNGVFGDAPFFLGVTYTVSLEIFALLAALGVVLWAYTRASGDWQTRLLGAVGEASLIFGALVAGVVYVETRLLWGEILPGIHVWQGLPGGGGYPWGTEQVAYNTCFIPSVVRGDCEFLNYNELLLIALACVVVGFLLSYGPSKEREGVAEFSRAYSFDLCGCEPQKSTVQSQRAHPIVPHIEPSGLEKNQFGKAKNQIAATWK